MKSPIQNRVCVFGQLPSAVLAMVVTLLLGVEASASLITVSNEGFSGDVAIPTSTTDWLVGHYGTTNEKAGGTAIVTPTVAASSWDPSYPTFTYSDGTNPVSTTGEMGSYKYNGDNSDVTLQLHVDAGAGQVLLYAGCGGASANLTASLVGTAESVTVAYDNSAWSKFAIDYSSTQSQDLTLTLHDTSGGNHVGFLAVTMTAVPEPSTIISVAICAISLLAYAWRKRT